jgi:hypothetical protein
MTVFLVSADIVPVLGCIATGVYILVCGRGSFVATCGHAWLLYLGFLAAIGACILGWPRAIVG